MSIPRCRRAAIALAAACVLSPGAWSAAPQGRVVESMVLEPRAFGYLLGDVLTQRVLLPDGDSGAVSPPSIGRATAWLERRRVRIDDDAQGRTWMAIDYQVVNVAPTLTRIALPALTLTSSTGATLHVAQWPISVGPMTPADAFKTGDLQPLRPDRLAPPMAVEPLRRQMRLALGLLGLTLLAWAAWWRWRSWRESAQLPFARAWRQIRKPGGPNGAAASDAWVCLHRAVNETAGHVVHAGSLSGLFDRAPYLQPLRVQLEQFYCQSTARFFTPVQGTAGAPATSADLDAVRTLSQALYRAERREQR